MPPQTFDLDSVQSALIALNVHGWLFYDFRGSNPLARRILHLDDNPAGSRRWFYFVPSRGVPAKLVHELEPHTLDSLPGDKRTYASSQDLHRGVAALVQGQDQVAMEYSPMNRVPTLSRVDAGTVELVRSLGVEVVTSGDLVQTFEATWTDEQWQMHLEANAGTTTAFDAAWQLIRDRVLAARVVTELDVQQAIVAHFLERGLVSSYPPTVAVGAHSSDPHYSPTESTNQKIGVDDFVLIDLWAKRDLPHAVYSDLTCVAYVGESVPDSFARVFKIVAAARDRAIALVSDSLAAGASLHGWEVDRLARTVIEDAGYGRYFIHRTGHSLGEELHGNGANMDDFETHEERLVMRRTCFSVEPGIYLPAFGIRSEVNVFVDAHQAVHVTGLPQKEILPILADAEPRLTK